MTAATSDSHAPKFHVDRSGYAAGLQQLLADARTGGDPSRVVIGDLDIPVATGFSNETAVFSAAIDGRSQRFVARVEPTGGALFPTQTPAAAVSVDLQYRIMDAVGGHSATPVPPLVAFTSDTSLLGAPFFVMEFIDGRVPSDTPRYTEAGFVVDEATPQQRRQMVSTGLAAMALVHRVDWRTADLDWLDPSGAGHPTQQAQVELYRSFIGDRLAGRDHPVLAAGLDWLAANDPQDERVGLSWGDARLGNIIWEGYEPAAVVDWEAAALCPTEADIGWWLMFDRMSFDDCGVERLAGYPTRAEQIELYEAASEREVRDPHYWEVFAIARFATVFIGLGDRLVSTGLLPDEMNPAVGNHVTEALAARLDIDCPTPNTLGDFGRAS